MPYLEDLYVTAIQISMNSQSPRIQNVMQSNHFWKVGIGVLNPPTTHYLLVGLNPGGNGLLNHEQNPQASVNENPSIQQYLQRPYRFAHYFNVLIEAFAQQKATPVSAMIPQFGTTDLSMYYSDTLRIDESFHIEVKETEPILKQHFSIPDLRGVIFSGRTDLQMQYFFLTLHRTGSQLSDVTQHQIHHWQIKSFRTTIFNEAQLTCSFIPQLSNTRGLSNERVAAMGQHLATVM